VPKIAVLSYASVNESHRAPYDALAHRPGWAVHIVAPRELELSAGLTKRCDPRPLEARYVLHPVPLWFGGAGRFVWFRHLREILEQVRPDIVFIEHDPGSVPVLQAALFAPRAKRYAFTVENIERDRFRDAQRALFARQGVNALRDLVVGGLSVAGSLATSGLACISEEGRTIFSKRFAKPIVVMPLGTDTSRFCPADARGVRSELGLEGGFVFGYFGRLVPEKGVHLLVEALALLPPRFRLLLDMFRNFEPGSYAASTLARADALGVRDRIVTIDVPHPAVPAYMRVCDAVVLPSLTTDRWKEQFGRVLPEAMACGVCVVGSDSGNIPHMIGDAGVVVPEGSAVKIADALLELDREPDRRARLAAAGRQRVDHLFSVDAQVSRMCELFEQGAAGLTPA
jgi:glycosyltransferase involved in cell wall biosynthesis